jgi:predicted phage terminase large subunit-like protein
VSNACPPNSTSTGTSPTVGIKLGRDHNGGYWLLDIVSRRANPGDVERILMNIATQDGKRVRIGFGKDPGQAGKSQAQYFVRALSNFTVTSASESGDKLTRFGPFSSQCRRRQRENPARILERGAVPRSRRLPRSGP